MKNKHDGYILSWAKRIRSINLLGGKCEKCKNNNIFVLEFHHFKDNKEFNINLAKRFSWTRIMGELKKCVILCKNCHSEMHFNKDGVDKRRSILKQKMLEYKNIFCCERCGYRGINYRSLEFHHKKQNEKLFNIFTEVWKRKKIKKIGVEENILKELDKCEVICRNCHGIEHINIDRFKLLEKEIRQKANSMVELVKVDRETIVEMHKSGFRNSDIAKKIGCANSSVTYALKLYHSKNECKR